MRYLAVDLGDKRTGIACGDDETSILSPVATLHIARAGREDELASAVVRAAHEHEAHAIVIGLPLNMDGTEGPRAALVRAFGRRVEEHSALPVYYHDERLTSFAADKKHLDRSGKTRKQKKAVRDQLAAVELLRDFLASQNVARPDED